MRKWWHRHRRGLLRLATVVLFLSAAASAWLWLVQVRPFLREHDEYHQRRISMWQRWQETQWRIRWAGWTHDDFWDVSRYGDKEWAAWIIRRVRAGKEISECGAGHQDEALRCITNQDPGAGLRASRETAWLRWWELNHSKTQRQWVLDGFAQQGLRLGEKLTDEEATALLSIIGDRRESKQRARPYQQFNAQRWLRDSHFEAMAFALNKVTSETPPAVRTGLETYASFDRRYDLPGPRIGAKEWPPWQPARPALWWLPWVAWPLLVLQVALASGALVWSRRRPPAAEPGAAAGDVPASPRYWRRPSGTRAKVLRWTAAVLLVTALGLATWWGANWAATARLDAADCARIGDWDAVGWILRWHPRNPLAQPAADALALLHRAARQGGVETVRVLLARGVAVNPLAKGGPTLLHEAVRPGHLEVVRLLLDHGAAVDAAAADGWTPLHEAARRGHLEVVRLLLDRGAASDAHAKDGRAPLHQAVASGRVEVVQLLLDRGAVVNAAAHNGQTPLDEAAHLGQVEVVRLLLDRGAAAGGAAEGRPTPLHEAAGTGAVAVVRLLLDRGVAVNAVALNGWTPLHEAAGTGTVEVVRLLLDRGAAVNAADQAGKTPLHVAAVLRKDGAVVRLLLERGAAPAARDVAGKTPADVAGNEEVRALLTAALPPVSPEVLPP